MQFQRKYLRDDLIAGLTGAVAGAPQAMGFAIIAGVSPLYGLYAAFVGTIFGAIFSNSTMMTIGPTNALAVVVGSTLLPFDQVDRPTYLFVLTILVGVFQLSFSLLRLGSLTRFVSNAVMTGFITGAGMLIIFGQLEHLTGYESHVTTGALPRFWDWLIHLPQSNLETTIIGVIAVVMIYNLHHTRFKSFATLIAMIVTTGAVLALSWASVSTVETMGQIPSALPDFVIPKVEFATQFLSVGFALAVLASVQSAALVNSIPPKNDSDSKNDDNRDLLGQGIANIIGGFFQSLPVGGSLSRTAVNISAGARTRNANIFAGVFVGLTLVLFGSVIEQITLAALAGHLVVAALSLISLDRIRMVWRVNMPGRIAMVATFASTLILPLEYSIYVGVFLSLGLYVYTSSERLRVNQMVPMGDNRYRRDAVTAELPPDEVVIYDVHGHLYFAAVKRLESLLPKPSTSHHTFVILRIHSNDYLGSTGIRFLTRYKQALQHNGGELLLVGVSEQVKNELERTGAIGDFGRENVFVATDIYFQATEIASRYARELLAKAQAQESETPTE